MFHNTINADKSQVADFNIKVKGQMARVFEFFHNHPGKQFTPFEVQKALDMYYHPITSIRRAITDLTTEGKLVKCDKQRTGPYGKANYTWKLNTIVETKQMALFDEQ